MPWNTLIDVSREHVLPLTVQIQENIKREISEGALHPGTRLPSSRQLAEDLGVSRSVVVEAYGQLVAEGYLEAAQGSGTRVAAHLTTAPQTPTLLADSRPAPVARWDLRAHNADPAAFPEREWLAAYQRAVRRMEPRELGYPPLSGLTALRAELAGYLGRARGVHTTREHVMVVAGFAQALGMVCEVLPRLGIGTLAVEDPCHPQQRQFIGESGLRCRPVPVDEDGIDVAALARSGARAVLVTPTHQFPTGVVLSAERRAALVRWAQEVDGWIVEDDYDGDLWLAHGRRPTALQRLDPSRVLYAGTASKSLAPGMRLGWLAVPPRLRGPLEEARARRDLGCEAFTQLAFAEFLATGLFDRHLRRRRARLRARAEIFQQAVRRHLPGARITGSMAGLHAGLQLPHRVDEPSLVAQALRRSVLVRGGRTYHHRPWLARPSLVVGYASPARSALAEAVRELGEACADLTGGRRLRTA
ncbi:putative transcriptional regulator, GntR family domain or Aspartate aminotransferase [Streptomyces viridochromogenes Tue57]|uniref:Putative transcriptional regulator, GntR family domain or Aspartate aminotransferase n=1 Tax=Streptomyces viridochromogenes Tue57 TaxID=1160705 RepID=L8PAV3_STRVR|nr:putative transcriptional regulator, GntR family domain or Aspartate aminotransferase [Streptomyces viridochromogenes Tue57]